MQPLDERPGAAALEPAPAVPAAQGAGVVPMPDTSANAVSGATDAVAEIGGPAGPDPSRYGDWERRGRCIDF